MAGNQPTTARVLRESRLNAANGVVGTNSDNVMSESQLPPNIKKISPDADAFSSWNVAGDGAPAAAPKKVGSTYTNTANGDLYVARNTAAVSGWFKIVTGGGSTGTDPQWYGTQSAYDAINPKDASTTYNIVPA